MGLIKTQYSNTRNGDSASDLPSGSAESVAQNTSVSLLPFPAKNGILTGRTCDAHCVPAKPASPVVRTPDGRVGKAATCEVCHKDFVTRPKNAGRFCSKKCYREFQAENPAAHIAGMIHQSDDQKLKVRANGLINMRLRKGIIKRPERCELCNTKGRVDAAHIDYDLPHVVTWVCRSCHMRSHFDPILEQELKDAAKPRGDPPPPYQYERPVYSPDGRSWASASACARDLGVSASAVIKGIKRGHRIAGLALSYDPADFSPALRQSGGER